MALGIFLPSGPQSKAPAAQLKTVHRTVFLTLLQFSKRDNQIYIAYQLRSFDFGVSFCVDFGSSEQSSCGAAKNSPQDCFLNAATVLKEIIIIRFISSEVSTSELLFVLTSSPRSCKNNKFVQIDHTHREIVCFAKFFNVMNVVYSFVAANSVRHLIWLQNQINKIPIMLKNIVR